MPIGKTLPISLITQPVEFLTDRIRVPNSWHPCNRSSVDLSYQPRPPVKYIHLKTLGASGGIEPLALIGRLSPSATCCLSARIYYKREPVDLSRTLKEGCKALADPHPAPLELGLQALLSLVLVEGAQAEKGTSSRTLL